jgi:hypothetical protein
MKSVKNSRRWKRVKNAQWKEWKTATIISAL